MRLLVDGTEIAPKVFRGPGSRKSKGIEMPFRLHDSNGALFVGARPHKALVASGHLKAQVADVTFQDGLALHRIELV